MKLLTHALPAVLLLAFFCALPSFVGMVAEQGGPAAPACPALGRVVKPEGTPAQVCGVVPVSPHDARRAVSRCWDVVTTAWERYYACGGGVAPDAGVPDPTGWLPGGGF